METQLATLNDSIIKLTPEIKRALPAHMDAGRFARIVLTLVKTNPKLLECTPVSLYAGVLTAAQMGLELGNLGHCYLVPFYNGKTKQQEVQFILGYRGMLELARRSGDIEDVYSYIIYENDEYEIEIGTNRKVVHKPAYGQDRGKPILVYTVANFKSGGKHIEIMDMNDVNKIKARSKAKEFGPWITDEEEMIKKTCFKRAGKYMPSSITIQNQVSQDEVVKRDIESDMVNDSASQSVYDIPEIEQAKTEEKIIDSDVTDKLAYKIKG